MGSVQKRSDRGGRYRARWINPETGMEQTKMFRRKEEATKYVIKMEASKIDGMYVADSSITVGAYAKAWAQTRPHRATTAERTAYLIEKHIVRTNLGRIRLSAVRPSMVQGWVKSRSQVLAPSTLRLVVGVLRSVLSAAVADRLISASPATRLSLPKLERERIVPLTVAQVQALADAMPPHCKAMVITQAGLGLRLGELLALRVQDVDFLRGTVHITEQLNPDGTDRVPLKTPSSRRDVPLPAVVRYALAKHLETFPPRDDGLIFTTKHKLPWRHDYYGSRTFARAVRDAGLSGTTSHSLRHHYASVLLHAGESVVAVAERLGHENAQLVIKVYGHLMPNTEDRTRRAIDAAWTVDEEDVSQVR